MELRAAADTLLVSFAFLAALGAGWVLSWPVGRAAHRISHRTGFSDRSSAVAATARWTVRLVGLLVAFAIIGIAAIAVLQLLLVGVVIGGAIAAGITFGFAGRERFTNVAVAQKKSYQHKAKPLPELGSQFESQTPAHSFQHEPFEPQAGNAILYGLPQGDEPWIERSSGDRRASKTRFDWGLIERRAVAERRSVS